MKSFFGPILARLIGAGVAYAATAAAHKAGVVLSPDQQAAAVVAVYGVVHHAVPSLVPALSDSPTQGAK